MNDEQLEKLCKCIRLSAQEGNLAARRTVYAANIVAGGRTRVNLKELRTEGIKAFALALKAWDTLSGGDETGVAFLIDWAGDDANAQDLLADGAGQYLAPGASHEHAIPGGAHEFTIDTLGVDMADLVTAVPGKAFTLHVFEMVPAFTEDRC
jgi:hypothetical protein